MSAHRHRNASFDLTTCLASAFLLASACGGKSASNDHTRAPPDADRTGGAAGAPAGGASGAPAGGQGGATGGSAGTTAGTSGAMAGTGGDAGEDAGIGCQDSTTSDLPGVALSVLPSDCTVTVAQIASGVTFRYRLEVTQPLEHVVAQVLVGDRCGSAQDASGLVVAALVTQGAAEHCLTCTWARCRPNRDESSLQPGVYDYSVTWQTTGSDPSDLPVPTPGVYTLRLLAEGLWTAPGSADAVPFLVEATRTLSVDP